MHALRAGLVSATLALATGAARADEPAALRPCAAADLIGEWQLARLRAASSWRVDRRDPWYYPYQRFVFAAGGEARELRSTRSLTRAARSAFLSAPPTATWSIDERGWVTIVRADTAPESVACHVVATRVSSHRGDVAEAGDVVLTSYDGDRPVVRRQLVRVLRPGR